MRKTGSRKNRDSEAIHYGNVEIICVHIYLAF